jgi:hypothetical protein
MRKNTIIFICLLLAIASCRSANAGCTGLCLSLDSLGYNPNLIDTAYITPGGNVKIFATYNEACHMIMEGQNPAMQLVWYKDGVPYDTTDLSNATYDNIWTYYTQYYFDEPGLYEIYFMGFYQPGYSCKQIRVLEKNNTVGGGPFTSAENIKENDDQILVYPNPSYEGMIYIHSKKSGSRIELFDINGTKILDMVIEKNNLTTLNTYSYKKGLYLLRISVNGDICTRKILIN